MWFNPGALLKNKAATPANFANPANYAPENSKTAPIISKLAGLAEGDSQKILSWLSHIGETDQDMIDETLSRCADNPETLAYFLMRAEEVPKQTAITCRHCEHFKSFATHGGGAGTCDAGVMPSGLCWWADAVHPCDQYQSTD